MGAEAVAPNPWMVLPFVALLAAIALGPLLFAEWWSRHYAKLAGGLAAITVGYYVFGLSAVDRVFHAGYEYISFIVLIGSLFVVSGGIHIRVKGEATPRANTIFLLVGAVLANVLGTTGASMLLIRPWLRMNKYRVTGFHVVFFIFIVSNVGGCLTPIGDPPLFLGYLKGIPFWWVVANCWPMWVMGVGLLLAIFYVLDRRNYRRAPRAVRDRLAGSPDEWQFIGLRNIAWLAVILGSVFVSRPAFLRESLMLSAAVASYFTTPRTVHTSNEFTFHPIREVAILFIGIFGTMLPALDWLQLHAGDLGRATPVLFYWGTGVLSSFLDNAPTYLSFLNAAFGMCVSPEVVAGVQHLAATGGAGLLELQGPDADSIRATYAVLVQSPNLPAFSGQLSPETVQVAFLLAHPETQSLLAALSVGAVFFGANTYIGNGPNFLVKSIADYQKIHVPGFIGYIWYYTLPFMLPVLLLVFLAFFT